MHDVQELNFMYCLSDEKPIAVTYPYGFPWKTRQPWTVQNKIQILINRLKKGSVFFFFFIVRIVVVSLLLIQFLSGCSSSRKCCNEQRTQQMLPQREAPQINKSNEAETFCLEYSQDWREKVTGNAFLPSAPLVMSTSRANPVFYIFGCNRLSRLTWLEVLKMSLPLRYAILAIYLLSWKWITEKVSIDSLGLNFLLDVYYFTHLHGITSHGCPLQILCFLEILIDIRCPIWPF